MRSIGFEQANLHWYAALGIPLAVRFANEGADLALKRVSLLAVVMVTVFLWSAVISRRVWPAPLGRQIHFSLLFVLLLFETGSWTGTIFAVSFGWIFAYVMFGGKSVLSPALVAMAVAIFSFPDTGFQEKWVTNSEPNFILLMACLPGAVWLAWRKMIALPVLAGVALGVFGAVMLFPLSLLWWEHLLVGSLLIGVVFIAADTSYAPNGIGAQIFYGGLIGFLIIALRLANPDQPDGVIFAILVGSLFAPFVEKVFAWRPNHGS